MTSGLSDETDLLNGPAGFAAHVVKGEVGLDGALEKVLGFGKFASTFVPKVLESEFGASAREYPQATRDKTAELVVDLEGNEDGGPAQTLLYAFLEICDLEIELSVTYGSEDEDLEDYNRRLLDAMTVMLQAFAGWLPQERFPKLYPEAQRVAAAFTTAAEKIEAV